jgi:uncharacterized protein YggT (Ycf19 family)
MQYGTWDTLFNILVLLFWFGLWIHEDDRRLYFNPYLTPLARASGGAIQFLRPVFFGLSARAIAAAAIGFLLVLRGLAAPAQPAAWIVRFGFEIRQPAGSAIPASLLFSVLSFAIFLFKLWGLSLLFAPTPRSLAGHSAQTVHELARPFTRLRPEFRPVALLGFGIVIAAALNAAGAPSDSPFSALTGTLGRSPAWALRYAISTLAAWVDLLLLVRSTLLVLIIGSWIGTFTGAVGIAAFCRDWTDLLLGPLRRYPIRFGLFDLTPLVVLLAIQYLVYPILMGILLVAYGALA